MIFFSMSQLILVFLAGFLLKHLLLLDLKLVNILLKLPRKFHKYPKNLQNSKIP